MKYSKYKLGKAIFEETSEFSCEYQWKDNSPSGFRIECDLCDLLDMGATPIEEDTCEKFGDRKIKCCYLKKNKCTIDFNIDCLSHCYGWANRDKPKEEKIEMLDKHETKAYGPDNLEVTFEEYSLREMGDKVNEIINKLSKDNL